MTIFDLSTVTVRVISIDNRQNQPKMVKFQIKRFRHKPLIGRCKTWKRNLDALSFMKVIVEDLSVSEMIHDLAVDLLWTAG